MDMQIDPRPDLGPDQEGPFTNFTHWFMVLDFLPVEDVCTLSEVCSNLNQLIMKQNHASEYMWMDRLNREHHVTQTTIHRFVMEKRTTMRELAIAFFRSKLSATGCPKPKILQKHVRKNPKLKDWMLMRSLRPFWVLDLDFTQRQGVWPSYISDDTSYFKHILDVQQAWNICIEGSTRVWIPGFYRVIWRIKLDDNFLDLSPLQFHTKVVPSSYQLPSSGTNMLTAAQQDFLDRTELKWANEQEFFAENPNDESRHVFIWTPPNPINQQPQVAALGVAGVPAGPQQQPQLPGADAANAPPPAFGFQVQQQLFQLQQQLNNNNNAPAAVPIANNVNANNDNNDNRNILHNDDNNNNQHNMNPDNPAARGDIMSGRVGESPFPVEQWFDLLTGFIHVPVPGYGVCFAAVNSTMSYKYGLKVDYVQLIPVTEEEFIQRDSFPCGPLLMDTFHYWDTLCESRNIGIDNGMNPDE